MDITEFMYELFKRTFALALAFTIAIASFMWCLVPDYWVFGIAALWLLVVWGNGAPNFVLGMLSIRDLVSTPLRCIKTFVELTVIDLGVPLYLVFAYQGPFPVLNRVIHAFAGFMAFLSLLFVVEGIRLRWKDVRWDSVRWYLRVWGIRRILMLLMVCLLPLTW